MNKTKDLPTSVLNILIVFILLLSFRQYGIGSDTNKQTLHIELADSVVYVDQPIWVRVTFTNSGGTPVQYFHFSFQGIINFTLRNVKEGKLYRYNGILTTYARIDTQTLNPGARVETIDNLLDYYGTRIYAKYVWHFLPAGEYNLQACIGLPNYPSTCSNIVHVKVVQTIESEKDAHDLLMEARRLDINCEFNAAGKYYERLITEHPTSVYAEEAFTTLVETNSLEKAKEWYLKYPGLHSAEAHLDYEVRGLQKKQGKTEAQSFLQSLINLAPHSHAGKKATKLLKESE